MTDNNQPLVKVSNSPRAHLNLLSREYDPIQTDVLTTNQCIKLIVTKNYKECPPPAMRKRESSNITPLSAQ